MLSDLSVFHRLESDDIEMLTAQQFWPRVRRLMHYNGAVLAVAMAEARESGGPANEPPSSPEARQGDEPVLVEDPTPEQVRAMRDAARRRRYPEAQYGEMRYVSDQEIVRKAGTSA